MSADVFTESEVSLLRRIEALRDFAVPQTNITFAPFGHHVVAVDTASGFYVVLVHQLRCAQWDKGAIDCLYGHCTPIRKYCRLNVKILDALISQLIQRYRVTVSDVGERKLQQK